MSDGYNWNNDERVQSMVNSYDQRYSKNFWNILLERIKPNQIKSFMDVGCGPGLLIQNIRSKYEIKVENIVGIDESEKMIGYAEKTNPDVKFITNTVTSKFLSTFDKKFDMVFLGLILHEFDNPYDILKSLTSKLNKNGWIVIYEFELIPIEDYVKAYQTYRPDFTLQETLNRFPRPAKYHMKDIEFLLDQTDFLINITSEKTSPLTGLVFGQLK